MDGIERHGEAAEHGGNDGNDEFGDFGGEVRALFGTVVSSSTPVVGFTPDGVAAAGRVYRRKRMAAGVGGVAAVAMMAVSAFVATGSTGGATLSGHPATTPRSGPAGRIDLGLALDRFRKDLDPHGRYVPAPLPDPHPNGVFGEYWTLHGTVVVPSVFVSFEVGPSPSSAMPTPAYSSSQGPAEVALPFLSKTLLDGSTVTTGGYTSQDSASATSRRTWTDGSVLIANVWLRASDTRDPADPFKPFAITEAQIQAAMSDPALVP